MFENPAHLLSLALLIAVPPAVLALMLLLPLGEDEDRSDKGIRRKGR